MIKFIKENNKTIWRVLLTGYLFYWFYAIWNIELSKITYPLELFIVLSIQISFSVSISIYLYFLWFKNNDKDNFNRNTIIGITVITIVAFPITYGILILGRNLSQFDGVQIGSADGWLSFIGSIIGGLVTMIAVVITINNENKKRDLENKERRRSEDIDQIPFLKITPLGFNETLEGKRKTILFYDSKNPRIIKFTQSFAVSNQLFNERPKLTQVAKTPEVVVTTCTVSEPFLESIGLNDELTKSSNVSIMLTKPLIDNIYPGYEDRFELVYTLDKSTVNINNYDLLDRKFINTSLNLYYEGHHGTFQTCIEFAFSFSIEEDNSKKKNNMKRYIIIQDSISNKILPRI